MAGILLGGPRLFDPPRHKLEAESGKHQTSAGKKFPAAVLRLQTLVRSDAYTGKSESIDKVTRADRAVLERQILSYCFQLPR